MKQILVYGGGSTIIGFLFGLLGTTYTELSIGLLTSLAVFTTFSLVSLHKYTSRRASV